MMISRVPPPALSDLHPAVRLAGPARPLIGVEERGTAGAAARRSEEHTSELQSLRHLVCRLLLEKKNQRKHRRTDEDTGGGAIPARDQEPDEQQPGEHIDHGRDPDRGPDEKAAAGPARPRAPA